MHSYMEFEKKLKKKFHEFITSKIENLKYTLD